jgi:hypothetical protein
VLVVARHQIESPKRAPKESAQGRLLAVCKKRSKLLAAITGGDSRLLCYYKHFYNAVPIKPPFPFSWPIMQFVVCSPEGAKAQLQRHELDGTRPFLVFFD